MTAHTEIQRILASYVDAEGDERAAADAHVAKCPACAAVRDAYLEADALIAAAPDPALPPRLARPFASLLAQPATRRAGRLGLVFGRALAPVAVVLILLVAISVLAWTVANDGAAVTSTPTLTSTLTPTSISARETGAALSFAAAQPPAQAPAFVPTPAPAPSPRGNPAILFAGLPAHATITH